MLESVIRFYPRITRFNRQPEPDLPKKILSLGNLSHLTILVQRHNPILTHGFGLGKERAWV